MGQGNSYQGTLKPGSVISVGTNLLVPSGDDVGNNSMLVHHHKSEIKKTRAPWLWAHLCKVLASYAEAESIDTSGLDSYPYKLHSKSLSYCTNPERESFR